MLNMLYCMRYICAVQHSEVRVNVLWFYSVERACLQLCVGVEAIQRDEKHMRIKTEHPYMQYVRVRGLPVLLRIQSPRLHPHDKCIDTPALYSISRST